MLKKTFLFVAVVLGCSWANAQINNIIVVAETGPIILSESENLSFFLYAEPKLKIAESTFIGLRIGLVINPQKFENSDSLRYEVDAQHDNGGFAFVPTIDYYFGDGNFRPYMSLGIGAYLFSRFVDVNSYQPNDTFEVQVKKQFGALFRGGLESNKMRFGLEYNFIQNAAINLPNGEKIGSVNNSYLGVSVGYVF